ncbi:glycosyl hydrolase family 61-domain-containing protein [Leptodontidium sp. MPI-SDFR-AT-0119]|nr:glycosyl hydrolase family 61-domain-containing protein [Leptodontidium sp. MPI-SDFR-AT-0119]
MKSLSILALVATSLIIEGYYIFNRPIVRIYSQKQQLLQPSFTADVVNSNDMRCNKGAKPGSTKTYTIEAGDKIGFKLFNNEFIEHPGSGFVYMSKSPDSTPVSSYDGSGDWFKLWEAECAEAHPSKTGTGEYLVRVEHIGLHEAEKRKAQFYIECYELKINGAGGGTPGPLVKIPGIYKADDPGIRYNKWAANPPPYVMPGPKVWDLS